MVDRFAFPRDCPEGKLPRIDGKSSPMICRLKAGANLACLPLWFVLLAWYGFHYFRSKKAFVYAFKCLSAA